MNITWNKPSLSRDFAFFTTLVVLVLSLAAIWVTYETYLEHSKNIVRRMETEATRIDRAMILEVEHSSYLLQALGQQISYMDVNDLKSIAVLLRSFDKTATIHHVFSWIDASNNNVVSSNKGVHEPIDVSDRDFVKKSIPDPWKIQIGNPMQGRISGKWVLPIALGIADSTGKHLGTILISMDIYTMTRDLQNAVRGSGISFSIYSREVLPLTQNIVAEKQIELDKYSQKLKSIDFSQHSSGVLATANLLDKNSMYIYYELSINYPYIIVLGFDSVANIASLRSVIMLRLIQIVLVGTFILTLLWLVRSRIIKPIAELADITAGIARGDRYREPSSIGGINELYILSHNVRKLGEYLHEMRLIEDENRNKNFTLKGHMESADFSNRIKTEFITSMSHELRTSVNTIAGLSEIIKNETYGSIDNPRYQQYVKDINDSSKQIQYLAEEVMQLSDAENALANLQEKHIDIRLILSKAIRLIGDQYTDQKIHIELKLPDAMPRLLMDENRLRQIIVNIIMNVADFTTDGGSEIVIKAYPERDNKGKETFCISFMDAKAIIVKPKNDLSKSIKPGFSHLNIPLTKALVAMHRVMLEVVKNPGKTPITILRFPKDRVVY